MKHAELLALIIFIALTNDSHSFRNEFRQQESMKIGGLFDQTNVNTTSTQEILFELAVKHVSEYRVKKFPRVEAVPRRIAYGEPLEALEALCEVLDEQIVGVISPSSPESATHVRNICDLKEVPLIATHWYEASNDIINLHPSPEDMGKAFLDLINYLEWEEFTIMFENVTWLPQIEYIFKNLNKKISVTIRQLDPTSYYNFRPQLMRVKYENKNILICSSVGQLPEILKQAQQVGLFNGKHSFILTSLDLHTVDLKRFQYSRTNLIGFRMISTENVLVNEFSEFLKHVETEPEEIEEERQDEEKDLRAQEATVAEMFSPSRLLLEDALIYDSVLLLTHVMETSHEIYPESISCDDPDSLFIDGMTLFNAIKAAQPFNGLTGEVTFNQEGKRGNFKLDVMNLTRQGLVKMGEWNSSTGLNVAGINHRSKRDAPDGILVNRTLTVLIAESKPYVMKKSDEAKRLGNDKYEGYCIELIEKLATMLNFQYEFKLQRDAKYGSPINAGKTVWNGMLGEINKGEGDLAVTDLTMTEEREMAFDFTSPFMILGIAILYEQPKPEDPDYTSFLKPFHYRVWGCLFASFILVSITMFIAGRMSDDDWENPYPCIEEPDRLHNILSIKNCVWFAMGSLFQQGSDIAPQGTSGRLLASIWWFVTMIIYASYTANLVSFLTVENKVSVVKDVTDLFPDKIPPGVLYGAKTGGSTFLFFRNSSIPEYVQMFEKMSTLKLPVDNDEGVEKVAKGSYAFFMESSSIEYEMERNCKITQVGNKLDEKGYGIAMKKGSPYRGELSEGVLRLHESGELSQMKIKWWKEKGGGLCDSPPSEDSKELNIHNVKGVFLVLFSGCLYGILEGIMRWFINMGKLSKAMEISFFDVFKEEFSFFLRFKKHIKPVHGRNLSSLSINRLNKSHSHSKTSCNTIEA